MINSLEIGFSLGVGEFGSQGVEQFPNSPPTYLPNVLYLPVCEYGIVKLPTGVPTVTSPLTR